MREYELYLVLDADAEEEKSAAVLEKVSQMISAGHAGVGGEVLKTEARGKRRLTYPIKRKVDGQDFVLTFRTPQPALGEIERFLKLDEQVLRYLLIRLSEE